MNTLKRLLARLIGKSLCRHCGQPLGNHAYAERCPHCGGAISSRPVSSSNSSSSYTSSYSSLRINPLTGNPILDLVPQSEREDSVRAQRSLGSDDEAHARRLCKLLADLQSHNDPEYAEIRRIGEELNQKGGFERMRLVCLRVRALGGRAGALETAWDHIGQWLA